MNNNIEETIKRIQFLCLDADIKTDEGIRHFHHGHEYVEIGGMKWATMNVGAKSVTDVGLYFQWGDTEGWSVEQIENNEKVFIWDGYKYCNKETITRYGIGIDGKTTILESCDDAAQANMGGNWRMPTFEEVCNFKEKIWITEIYSNSKFIGLLCRDKENNNSIIFRNCGFASGWSVNVGPSSYLWTSSTQVVPTKAHCVVLTISGCDISSSTKNYGFNVRGIVD